MIQFPVISRHSWCLNRRWRFAAIIELSYELCNGSTRPLGAGGSWPSLNQRGNGNKQKIQQFFTISSRARYKSSASSTIKDQLEWILSSWKRESECWPSQLFSRVSIWNYSFSRTASGNVFFHVNMSKGHKASVLFFIHYHYYLWQ